VLPKRKVLDRKFNAATQDAMNKQHQDANPTHLTASADLLDDAKTIAKASKRSNRKSFADKAYGLFGRHTGRSGSIGHAKIAGRTHPLFPLRERDQPVLPVMPAHLRKGRLRPLVKLLP
jgi:hypothetical protein